MTLFLSVMAAARLIQLINADRVFNALHRKTMEKWGTESWQAYLWSCPWCVGFWAGLIIGPPLVLVPASPWFLVPVTILALAQMASMLMILWEKIEMWRPPGSET